MPEGRQPSLVETYSEVAPLVHAQEHLPRSHQGFLKEARLFLELAIPTSLLSVGANISPLLTASVVGRKFGQTYLSAFTLANLTGNLCTFSLLWGLFSAADTLSPQAFGRGDFKEVGYQAMRGLVIALSIVVPSNILLFIFLENILIALGQDPEAAAHAAAWYRIFVVALPFVVIFTTCWKFLSAQHVMMPLIHVSLFSCVIVLPVALEIMTGAFGFLGSAMAFVIFQATQCILLLTYLYWRRPHVAQTLPGLGRESWRQALQWQPLMTYLSLGAGGMFAQSEWIFWEALGLIIGLTGVLGLSAHTVANQVIMLSFVCPYAFGTALAIRMGIKLSQKVDNNIHSAPPDSVRQTQRMVMITVGLSTTMFVAATMLLYILRLRFYSFFTTEPEVIALVERIWWKVCVFGINCSVFAQLIGVVTGLGMQWYLGSVNFFFLYGFGLPVTYYSTITLGGGLEAAWTCINVPYALMNITLLGIFFFTDWHKIQEKILSGEIVQDPEVPPRKPVDRQEEGSNEKAGLLNDHHAAYNEAGDSN
jgi:multidrug resistance protein, MATE family